MPSGNAVALRALRFLGDVTGEPSYAEAAGRTTRVLAGSLERAPSLMGTAVAALASTPTPPSSPVSVTGRPAGTGARSAARLPRSDDRVRVTLERDPRQPLDLTIQLVIDEGWHVNANPASLPFLIPTAVEFRDGVQPERIHYPPGKAFHPAFSDEALSVYEGRV